LASRAKNSLDLKGKSFHILNQKIEEDKLMRQKKSERVSKSVSGLEYKYKDNDMNFMKAK